MLNWTAWPRGIRWLVWVAAVVLALLIVWTLLVPGADWLAHHDVGSAKGMRLQTARDAARGRLLTLGAGLVATGALLFTARNFILSREGQVTDRYTKAIDQLGSKELDVRIGGIYALERIARDSAKDHPTVMEVLTAFIRDHSREPWPPPDTGSSGQTGAGSPYGLPGNPPEQERVTRPDVQAAATVIRRRNAKGDIQPIDLTRADLAGANLGDATLTDATLTDAILVRAGLVHADLTGANLDRADLTGATLNRPDLTDAILTRANLARAFLQPGRVRVADVFEHRRATLARADLTSADLSGAHLEGADLSGAHLGGADLSGAHLSGVRWPEGVPVPEGWMVDTDSGRLEKQIPASG